MKKIISNKVRKGFCPDGSFWSYSSKIFDDHTHQQNICLITDGKQYIIGNVLILHGVSVSAYYKKHAVDIWKDEEHEDGRFYARIENPHSPFPSAFDGWVPSEIDNPMEALIYALKGALLIENKN